MRLEKVSDLILNTGESPDIEGNVWLDGGRRGNTTVLERQSLAIFIHCLYTQHNVVGRVALHCVNVQRERKIYTPLFNCKIRS